MQQRKPTSGRPYGTDGSDFSYRMVVDPRYTKVAEGKSRLRKLIIIQAVIQLIGVLCTFLLPPKQEGSVRVAILSIISGSISVMIGELGRSRSKANFLRLYMVASSVATLLSIVCIATNSTLLEVIQDPSGWTMKKFELIEPGRVLIGVLVEILAITTTVSLVKNMSPPKRAS
ncbi:Protein of unknown function DUF1352 [Macleaya cordata]|uniref:Uncharacterized protein n=1 Tax=Macleaya cordata TaxID=56857 RepID=A0A200PXS5_MACCD|nr:Protein of unknown function DUF1352 [Macleaya cordata]